MICRERRTITPLSVLSEWCPFVLKIISDNLSKNIMESLVTILSSNNVLLPFRTRNLDGIVFLIYTNIRLYSTGVKPVVHKLNYHLDALLS